MDLDGTVPYRLRKQIKRVDEQVSKRKKMKTSMQPHFPMSESVRASSIFRFLRMSDIEMAMNRFLEVYNHDKMQGVFEVKICILSSTGCSRNYDRGITDNDEYILSYFEEWHIRNPSPALLYNTRQKEFPASFKTFFETLIKTCEMSGILYDNFMLDKLLLFLECVASSDNERFRHAATLSALITMRSLFEITCSKNELIRKHNSQLNSELQKPEEQQELLRVLELKTSIGTLKHKLEKVKRAVEYLRKDIFETRIRDSNNYIRSVCFLEIREWLHIQPEIVVQDKYLEYLICPFTNKAEVATVRKICFSILKFVLGENLKVNADVAQNFAKRIKSVLLRLAMSSDRKLAPDAFYLLSAISKFDVFEDDDVKQFIKFVYLDHPSCESARIAAGQFIIALMKNYINEETATSVEINLLRTLVYFHIRFGSPGTGAFLVNSVFEYTPIFHNWKVLKRFLRETQSDEEKKAFLEILACCVRRAVMGQLMPGTQCNVVRPQNKKKLDENRMQFSAEFIDILPSLIKGCQSEPAEMGNLLIIAQCVTLDCYVALRSESRLIELLKEIRIVVEMSADGKVFEECAKCFNSLCDKAHATYTICAPIIDLMTDDFVQKCLEAFQTVSEVEPTDLLLMVKRVAAFSGYFIMWSEPLFNLLIKQAHGSLSYNDNTSQECAKYSLLFCRRFLVGSIKNILNFENYHQDQIDSLHPMLCYYLNVGRALLAAKNVNVRFEAFEGICQVLPVFGVQMARTLCFKNASALVYHPPLKLVTALMKFARKCIFQELPNDTWATQKEEAERRRRALLLFCSLLVNATITYHNVLVEIFGHYIKWYDLYKDILDGAFSILYKKDMDIFIMCIHEFLKSEFMKIKDIYKKSNIAQATDNLKKKATYFLKVLGENKSDLKQQHKAIELFHVKGIKFSMMQADKKTAAPSNIEYLEVLFVFVKLLTPKGCRHLCLELNFWNDEIFQETSLWKPLITYRKALERGRFAVK